MIKLTLSNESRIDYIEVVVSRLKMNAMLMAQVYANGDDETYKKYLFKEMAYYEMLWSIGLNANDDEYLGIRNMIDGYFWKQVDENRNRKDGE